MRAAALPLALLWAALVLLGAAARARGAAWQLVPYQGFLPAPRAAQAHAVAADVLVLSGGVSAAGAVLSELWRLDVAAGAPQWAPVAQAGAPALAAHCAVAAGGELFVFGGYDAALAPSDTLWRFSVANGTWSAFVPPPGALRPAAVEGCALEARPAAGGGSDLWLFGGFAAPNGTYSSDLWRFSPAAAAWTRFSAVDTPSGRRDALFAYLPAADVFLLAGGETNVACFEQTWQANVSCLLGANVECWSQPVDASPSGRAYPSGATVSDTQVIMFGGYCAPSDEYFSDLWVYDVTVSPQGSLFMFILLMIVLAVSALIVLILLLIICLRLMRRAMLRRDGERTPLLGGGALPRVPRVRVPSDAVVALRTPAHGRVLAVDAFVLRQLEEQSQEDHETAATRTRSV